MNNNLGNIPVEIYVDYSSEQTNQEWMLEFIIYPFTFHMGHVNMNTNLNNIPLEMYVDYCTEQTGQEWLLEHILTTISHSNKLNHNTGHGFAYKIAYHEANINCRGFGNGNLVTGCGYDTHEGNGNKHGYSSRGGHHKALGTGYIW